MKISTAAFAVRVVLASFPLTAQLASESVDAAGAATATDVSAGVSAAAGAPAGSAAELAVASADISTQDKPTQSRTRAASVAYKSGGACGKIGAGQMREANSVQREGARSHTPRAARQQAGRRERARKAKVCGLPRETQARKHKGKAFRAACFSSRKDSL